MATLFRAIRDWFFGLLANLQNGSGNSALKDLEARRKGDQIVQLLQSENWAELRNQFSLPLRWLLQPTVLKKGFDLVRLSTGSLEDVDRPMVSMGWFLTSVKIPIRFSRAKLALALTMTPHGGLIGLKFMPMSLAGLGNAWRAPSYGNVQKTEEAEVELGPPRLKVKGTLTTPHGTEKRPCIVLLPGSGPVDRDSSVGACKPFKDLALGLSGRGIATLRFDKVTLAHGAKIQKNENFTLTDEYLPHALAAISHALAQDKIREDGVFVLGHSLGGYVTPQLVSMEPRIAGCVLLATPSIPVHRSALKQLQHFASMDEEPTAAANEQIEELECQCDLADSEELTLSTPKSKLPFGLGPAYWLDFRNFNPIETAKELRKPVLVVQGGRDYQVKADEDYVDWQNGLADQPYVALKLYESLNHLLVMGEGASKPLEYDSPGNVAEEVIEDISQWVFESLGRSR